MNNEHFEQGGQAQTEQEVLEVLKDLKVPTSYEEFERLLKLQRDLQKQLHKAPPSGHSTLRRAIAELGRRLKDAPAEFWDRFNKEVAEGRLVG